MNQKGLKSDLQLVLEKMSYLLDNISAGKMIEVKEMNTYFEEILESREDIQKVHSLLLELQSINESMENMTWLNKHYRILHEFAQICSKTLDEGVLLKKAYEMVSQVMSTDSFYIALYNEGDTHIHFIFMVDRGEVAPPMLMEFGENYTSKVIKTGQTIHRKERNQSLEFDTTYGDEEEDTNSCLFVPVVMDGHVKGVVSAQCYDDFAYRKEHEELLQMIGTQVVNSIETARLYEKIYKMSLTDEMTGLRNHRAFHEDLSKLIKDDKQELTLIMIDSDNLKQVNDRYGHDIGDKYLNVLADGIKSISSHDVQGYRYAGDEFMIIIKKRMEDNHADIFDRLKNYYDQHPIKMDHENIFLSTSSGVAFYPEHGETVDSLKKSADEALYVAKEKGKNLIVYAE